VIAFFAKTSGLERSAFRARFAPLVAGLLLAIVTVAVVINFPGLTGANQALAYGLVALVPIAAGLGAIVAAKLKSESAVRFAELGAHQAE